MEEAWTILDYLPISFKPEEEQVLLSAMRQLVICFEEKIKEHNGRVWGED